VEAVGIKERAGLAVWGPLAAALTRPSFACFFDHGLLERSSSSCSLSRVKPSDCIDQVLSTYSFDGHSVTLDDEQRLCLCKRTADDGNLLTRVAPTPQPRGTVPLPAIKGVGGCARRLCLSVMIWGQEYPRSPSLEGLRLRPNRGAVLMGAQCVGTQDLLSTPGTHTSNFYTNT
jgi:hypothetical protein